MKRSQSEKATFRMILAVQHSGKGETVETVKISGCQGFGGGEDGRLNR